MQLYRIRVTNVHCPVVLLVQATAGTKLFPQNRRRLNLLDRKAMLTVPFVCVWNTTLLFFSFHPNYLMLVEIEC